MPPSVPPAVATSPPAGLYGSRKMSRSISAAMVHPDEEELEQSDFEIEILPGATYVTPLKEGSYPLAESHRPVLYNSFLEPGKPTLYFEQAGPHKLLHFNPPETTIGIVNCGGLCPGVNDVIKHVVTIAMDVYGVQRCIGFRYGYRGLCDEGLADKEEPFFELNPAVVKDINRRGGSFLGSSRGHSPDKHVPEMIKNLQQLGVNILIAIGGDGTLRGALCLHQEIQRRGLGIAVVGIPKTIDNDVCFIQKTFGFESAVSQAVTALEAARAEALSALYGVGIVKLMGRHSGFITAQAVISQGGAHIVLIPENPIPLETVIRLVDKRFENRKYCVIVVAEGFGQEYFSDLGTDASGNKKLGDIGVFLRDKINEHMKKTYPEYTIKYIDPSYMVRSCPPISTDAAFCLQLANHAVHEAMRGSTGCVIGYWHDAFTAVPIKLCVQDRKCVNVTGHLWRSVREITVSLSRRGRSTSSNTLDEKTPVAHSP
eukprot:TRINITY_DN3824_c0_g1_i1.p1 TRINITY_DN3824_c0_g1~~TRINITY_DN3824_c0_g1_i1.p1  ORF type:complete len:500 (+),score=93.65 TRINITY_DN3824_c0_g1_i1:46-1500(+)